MSQTVRAIIEIDESKCDGCGKCVPSCHEGALAIVGGKARVVADVLCDGLGACLGECPTGALKVVHRAADAFDEAMVARHKAAAGLAHRPAPRPADGIGHGRAFAGGRAHGHGDAHAGGGCPGSQLRTLPGVAAQPAPFARAEAARAQSGSALGHWPVQIRLVPPHAPFLRGADLLVAADCVPVAYPGFHAEMLPGRAVLIGCPKLDDLDAYVARFTAIFENAGLQKVTVAVMEVPCCQSLPMAIRRAADIAGVDVQIDQVTIGVGGDRLQ